MNQTKRRKQNENIQEQSTLPMDTKIHVDETLCELRKHGRADYPVGLYRINVKEHDMEIVPWHWHKEVEFIYIIEGCGEFLASDDSFFLYPGEALFINSEVMHSFQIASGYDNCIFISIVFDPGYLIHPSETSLYAKYIYPITQNQNIRGYSLSNRSPQLQSHLANSIKIYDINRQQEFGYEIYTKEYLTTIWFDILKEIKAGQIETAASLETKISIDESRTKEAIHYIEEHYNETITLDDIADMIHLSKSECCRCIKRCMNMTPFEYLMRFRILKAAQILAGSQLPLSIADLAQTVGINSSSYFNKLFKKYMGCTPSQYKKKMQSL